MSTNSTSPSSQPRSGKLQQRLVESFQQGSRLSSRKDFDYAHSMFSECVIGDPGNRTYVEAMLENLREKHPYPKGRGLFGRSRGDRDIKSAASRKEWSKVLRLGIDLLKDDPW